MPDKFSPEALEAAVAERLEGVKAEHEKQIAALRQEAGGYRIKAKETNEELAKLKAQFEGIDPEAIKSLLDEKKKIEEDKMKEKGEFDKVLAQHRTEWQKELDKLSKERDEAAKSAQAEADAHNKTILGYEIATNGTVAKCLNPRLLELTLSGEAKVETTESGKRVVRFYDEAGNMKLNAKTGAPLTSLERIEQMKLDKSFAMLFEGGVAGAGSGGGTGSGGFSGKNPWKKDSFNLTAQGKIYNENPDLAKRMMNEAGVTIPEGLFAN
jgi:hypothetical protein